MDRLKKKTDFEKNNETSKDNESRDSIEVLNGTICENSLFIQQSIDIDDLNGQAVSIKNI